MKFQFPGFFSHVEQLFPVSIQMPTARDFNVAVVAPHELHIHSEYLA